MTRRHFAYTREAGNAGPESRGPAAHDRRYAVDFKQDTRAAGMEPQVSLDQGLASTVDWYVQNRSWWRK